MHGLRAVRAVLHGVLLLCVTGCAGGATTGARPPHAVVAAPGGSPLRVGTSGDYPPFSVRGEDGVPGGFDVAVGRAYAAERGRPLELVAFRWPQLEQRLLAGDFDVAMSGVTVRGDRLALAPMTAAVARAAAVLVVPAARRAPVPSDGSGMRVAVNRGGHLERVARRRLPAATIVAVDDNRSLPRLLASGEVEGVVTDTLELGSFPSAGPPHAGATRVAAVLGRDRKAYWVSPGAAGLAADLDAWLAEREADGTLEALRARYLGGDAGPAPARLDPRAARAADLVGRRLLLMPEVAAAKRVAGLPVEVPEREAAVLARARAAAGCAGLAPEPYAALVRAQIAAAKSVQRAALQEGASAGGRHDQEGASAGGRDDATARAAARRRLDAALRPAIDRLDRALRAELARSAPLRAPPAALAAALRDDAPLPGFGAAAARDLARALLAIPAAIAGDPPEICA